MSYELEELLGTKLRAVHQRSKGRDLYDLAAAIERFPQLDLSKVVECFGRYLEHEGHHVSRAEFEESMAGKMRDPAFHGDIEPLLATAEVHPDASYHPEAAYRRVHEALIARLPCEPWKGLQ